MKMYLTFDTRIVLLISCLLQGLAGLRLIKVSIPAYKMRGESAFLECQYELSGGGGQRSDIPSVRIGGTGGRHHQHGNGDNGNDMNYVDTDSTGDEIPQIYRRMRTPSSSYQKQYHPEYRPYDQQQQEFYREQHQEQQTPQSGGYYHQQRQQQQQQQQYQQFRQQYQQHQKQQQQQQQQSQTQTSPYSHSVYRGNSLSSSSSSSALGGGGGNGIYGSHVSASTYTGGGLFGSYRRHGADPNGHHDESFEESMETNGEDDDDGEVEAEEEQESLYAIKWYKDNEEFYRYVPKANPPKTSYRFDGVRVIEEHSDATRVLLRGLTINSTGLYRCEVSAEAPNFSSVQGEGRMDIVFLPRDGPHIKGQQFQYQIGETLNLNCTSGKSHPASHLQWFINDQVVADGQYLMRYNDTVHKHGLITSTLGLQLTVDARHFQNGAMRVKCLASISPVLWRGDRESVLQRRSGIIDNREAMLLVRSGATRLHLHTSLSHVTFAALLVVMLMLVGHCRSHQQLSKNKRM